MKLLTVFASKRTELQADLLSRVLTRSGDLLHNENKIHMTLERRQGLSAIEISGRLPAFELKKDGKRVYAETAQALAEYIIGEEEPLLLRKLIRDEYHYKQEQELDQILSYCEQLLGSRSENDPEKRAPFLRRKALIASEIADYIQEQTELHLDGFIRFRLQAYKQELHDIVEYAVDEYVMDRQYQEFISLLQYFVYIQEAKIPFVHLIHKGGSEFMLLNDRMEKIDTDDSETVVTVELLEKDMNFEDMIVSTLITVSPQKIYIHTREPETQVIKTISQIFENRVELCGYCRLCQNLDHSTAAEYNKG
ncbi:putative sporulation protein YtxC [Paenibacillus sp.]|uniref:putative sporulation protein YtxC n=1 Tax=Paenibacillus sp. TaxID=58172 RepID=UPI00356A1DEB